MSRTRIGVTVSTRSGWRIFPMFALNVWIAGGRAVRWDSARDVEIDSVDGVVIGGGDDIQPTLYGGDVVAEARFDPDRDALERRIVVEAHDRNLPILGVCRGSQMINVALGGTLHQDAYGVYSSKRVKTVLPRKHVDLEEGTRLREIADRECLRVNALHTQAVKDLGQGLRVAGRDDGGMIQAIERIEEPFAVGVQWHPEHIIYRAAHRRIFFALVAAAKARAEARDQMPAVDAEVAT
jgi:putative glutamine amidotransferase